MCVYICVIYINIINMCMYGFCSGNREMLNFLVYKQIKIFKECGQ